MLIELVCLPKNTHSSGEREKEKLLGHIPMLSPGAFLQGVRTVFSGKISVLVCESYVMLSQVLSDEQPV